MSDGAIQFDEDAINNIHSDYKQHQTTHVSKGQHRNNNRNGHKNRGGHNGSNNNRPFNKNGAVRRNQPK